MTYGEPGWDWDKSEQVDMFNQYLEETADTQDRLQFEQGYGYDEHEWEAFCYGWNAAKKYFGVKE